MAETTPQYPIPEAARELVAREAILLGESPEIVYQTIANQDPAKKVTMFNVVANGIKTFIHKLKAPNRGHN